VKHKKWAEVGCEKHTTPLRNGMSVPRCAKHGDMSCAAMDCLGLWCRVEELPGHLPELRAFEFPWMLNGWMDGWMDASHGQELNNSRGRLGFGVPLLPFFGPQTAFFASPLQHSSELGRACGAWASLRPRWVRPISTPCPDVAGRRGPAQC